MPYKIKILTIFPELFDSFLKVGLVHKALVRAVAEIEIINIRDFSREPSRRVDDYPYGGGAGMLMKIQPVVEAIEAAGEGKRILLSAAGKLLTQEIVKELGEEKSIVLVCGRYEGIDYRVMKFVDMELSIGDFILHGGEVAAMAVVEAVLRLKPQFMGNQDSLAEESLTSGLLEYPQYTRPASFRGINVPEVLLSGNHSEIKKWRRGQALARTKKLRPDIFAKLKLGEEDKLLLEKAMLESE